MKIKKVIIHAADTPASMGIGAAEIRRWHVDERGLYNDISTTLYARRVSRLGHDAGRAKVKL